MTVDTFNWVQATSNALVFVRAEDLNLGTPQVEAGLRSLTLLPGLVSTDERRRIDALITTDRSYAMRFMARYEDTLRARLSHLQKMDRQPREEIPAPPWVRIFSPWYLKETPTHFRYGYDSTPRWAYGIVFRSLRDTSGRDPFPHTLNSQAEIVVGSSGHGVYLDTKRSFSMRVIIRFDEGRYWIQNAGNEDNVWLNGKHIPGEITWCPLDHLDVITFGEEVYEFLCPEAFLLDRIGHEIQGAPSPEALMALMRKHGMPSLAERIGDLLSKEEDPYESWQSLQGIIHESPQLAEKLQALLEERQMRRWHQEFLGELSRDEAFSRLESFVRNLADVKEPEEFIRVLEEAPIPFCREQATSVRRLFQGHSEGSPHHLTTQFGIQRIADRFVGRHLLHLGDSDTSSLVNLSVSPLDLVERPWGKINVPSRLQEALDQLKGVSAARLDLDQLEEQARTLMPDRDEAKPPSDRHLSTQKMVYRRYTAQDPSPTMHGPAQPGKWSERFLEAIQREKLGLAPQFPWLYGGAANMKGCEGRIYLPLRSGHALKAARYLSSIFYRALKAEEVVIQFKMAIRRGEYSRSDSGVIYFYAKDQAVVLQSVAVMYGAHPEFFRTSRPLFTCPIPGLNGEPLPALGFGEEPQQKRESFGGIRSQAITQGIRLARFLISRHQQVDWSILYQIFAYYLDQYGVDLEYPHFNKGGREKFRNLV